jgi:predicted O-linked N-acetylglucosamine transferase (SPINDLY family)
LKIVEELFQQALLCQRQGQIGKAESMYAEILALQPRHAAALHLLGSLALQRGSADKACELLGKSIDINPNLAAVHIDLAIARQSGGLNEEAMQSYDQAIRLEPDSLAAHFNRAVLLQQLQRLPEALKGYETALRLNPRFGVALFNRAVLLAALNRPQEALAAYDRCLQATPGHVEALNNRGVILLELKRPAAALATLDQALKSAPQLAKALNNRGNALRSLNRFLEAIDSFDRALAAQPDFAEAHRNRGDALRRLGQQAEALAGFDASLRLRPDHADTLLDRAQALIDLKRYADAKECVAALLKVAPQNDFALGMRLLIQGMACDWQDYDEHARELVAANNIDRCADFPFPFLAISDSAAAQQRCAHRFARDKFPAAADPLSKRRPRRHSKIRIAYVSGDLRPHPVSLLLPRIFELHDRQRFETIAISLRPWETSPLGKRVMAAFDAFIDVSQLSDREVAAQMHDREIDIAVDLMGYTHGCRLGIFAARPAAVQVNYLGYPGTLGARYMDYVIADEFLIPAEQRRHYTEKVVWLPDCFQANDDRRVQSPRIPSRRELSLPDFGFVFCCFNNSFKYNPTVFGVWMRLLAALPGSVLWLLADEPVVADNLRREARQRGIDADRLIFAGRVAYEDHLARLSRADLFLDTLPFNAGTTASDALWAGVPVLTCPGEAMAARMAGSLLRAVGLPELITGNHSEYEALAVKLATDPDLLSSFRARLASARRASALFDSARFCSHLESAYVSMWERAERGKSPEHFTVRELRSGS